MFRAFRLALLAAAVSLGTPSAGSAQTGSAESPSRQTFIDLKAPAATQNAAATTLLQKAARRGQVRVIVGLAMSLRDEDSLSSMQAAAQRQRLRADQDRVVAQVGVSSEDVVWFETIPFVSMWVSKAQLERLLTNPSVVNIQEDVPGTGGVTQSVPYIKAPSLWNKGVTGAGWTVAILDTGVQKSHPMFAGKVVSEACYSTKNAGQNATPLCPNGKTQQTGPGSGVNCNLTLGSCFHGTHVAGIAAGVDGNKRGVARGAKIIAIQVFSKVGKQTLTFSTDWVRGLERVYALRSRFKIAAINMSLGFGAFSGPCDTQVPSATAIIKKLRKAKIATIVASMNDAFNNKMRSPACIGASIAVGATGRTTDTIAAFSNHAPQVRHMAPGVDILSAVPNNKYKQENGTSMAAPHVAGAYALLRNLRPGSTVDDISAALECTGVPVTRANITERRIDLAKARQYLLKPPKTKKSFNFTSDAPGWSSDLGNWAQDNAGGLGVIFVQNRNPGFKLASIPNCNEGIDITARLDRRGSDTGALSGILYKAQFTNASVSGYFAAYSRTGQGFIRRFDSVDVVNEQSGTVFNVCSGSVQLSASGFQGVKVVTRGGQHKLIVNNKTVCSGTDFAYGTGRAGLLSYFNPGASGLDFAADSFTLKPVEQVPAKSAKEGTKLSDAEDALAVSGPALAVSGASRTGTPTAISASSPP